MSWQAKSVVDGPANFTLSTQYPSGISVMAPSSSPPFRRRDRLHAPLYGADDPDNRPSPRRGDVVQSSSGTPLSSVLGFGFPSPPFLRLSA